MFALSQVKFVSVTFPASMVGGRAELIPFEILNSGKLPRRVFVSVADGAAGPAGKTQALVVRPGESLKGNVPVTIQGPSGPHQLTVTLNLGLFGLGLVPLVQDSKEGTVTVAAGAAGPAPPPIQVGAGGAGGGGGRGRGPQPPQPPPLPKNGGPVIVAGPGGRGGFGAVTPGRGGPGMPGLGGIPGLGVVPPPPSLPSLPAAPPIPSIPPALPGTPDFTGTSLWSPKDLQPGTHAGPQGSGTIVTVCDNGGLNVTGGVADEVRNSGRTGILGWRVGARNESTGQSLQPAIVQTKAAALTQALRFAQDVIQAKLGKEGIVFIRATLYNIQNPVWIWEWPANRVRDDDLPIFNEDGSLFGDGGTLCPDLPEAPGIPSAPPVPSPPSAGGAGRAEVPTSGPGFLVTSHYSLLPGQRRRDPEWGGTDFFHRKSEAMAYATSLAARIPRVFQDVAVVDAKNAYMVWKMESGQPLIDEMDFFDEFGNAYYPDKNPFDIPDLPDKDERNSKARSLGVDRSSPEFAFREVLDVPADPSIGLSRDSIDNGVGVTLKNAADAARRLAPDGFPSCDGPGFDVVDEMIWILTGGQFFTTRTHFDRAPAALAFAVKLKTEKGFSHTVRVFAGGQDTNWDGTQSSGLLRGFTVCGDWTG